MADMPPVSYKLVIIILLLHTCSSYILLERSPTVTKIKEEAFLLEPYNEDLGTFVEITTDQKTKNVLSTESKEISLPLVEEVADEVGIATGPTIHNPDASMDRAIPEQDFPSLDQKYLALQKSHPLVGLTDLAIHRQEVPVVDVTHQFRRGHPLMALTNLAIQTARSPAGDLPHGVAPLALLIEQISQENAADMTKEKMFAMAKKMENMLKEILAPASSDPATAPASESEPEPIPVSEPEPNQAPEVSPESTPEPASAPVHETEPTTEPSSMDDALEDILLEIYAEPVVDSVEDEGEEEEMEEEDNNDDEEATEEMDMTHQVEDALNEGLGHILPTIVDNFDEIDSSSGGRRAIVGEVKEEILVPVDYGEDRLLVAKLQFALSFEEPEAETVVTTEEEPTEDGVVEVEQSAIHSPDSSIPLHYPIEAFPEAEYPFLPQEYLHYQQGHPLMGLADLAIHHHEASTGSVPAPAEQGYHGHPVMGLADLAIHQQEAPVTHQFPQGHPLVDLANLAIQTPPQSSGDQPQESQEPAMSAQFQQSHPLTGLMNMAIQQQGPLDLAALAVQHQGAPIQEANPLVESTIETAHSAQDTEDHEDLMTSQFEHPLMDLTNMAIQQQMAPMSTQFPGSHPLMDLTHMAISKPQNLPEQDHFLHPQGPLHPQLGGPFAHDFQHSHPMMDLTSLAIQPFQPSQDMQHPIHTFVQQSNAQEGQVHHQEGPSMHMQGHPLLHLANMAVQTTDHYPNGEHPYHPKDSFHPHGLVHLPHATATTFQGHPLVNLAGMAIQTGQNPLYPQQQSSLSHPFFGHVGMPYIGQDTPMMGTGYPGSGYGTNPRRGGGGGIPAPMLFSPGFGGYLSAR